MRWPLFPLVRLFAFNSIPLYGLELTHVRAEMYVCGSPKPLEDTVFMLTRYADEVPGTLMATRQAPGNRGGLRLRVYGSKGGVEWNLERAEELRLCVYGEPDQIITRGHGHGVSPETERFVRMGRGFSEGIFEAWANLYTEFAMAAAADKDNMDVPVDWLSVPRVEDGAKGVSFIHAVVNSDKSGAWTPV